MSQPQRRAIMRQTVKRHGVTQILHHKTYGNRNNTALLLAHPLGTDLRFWEECAAQWEKQFFCIAPDPRSAGQSPRPQAPVDLAGHAADLERLRVSLGVPKVVVIGCAIGAMIAATYAARYPDATIALIMTNPGVQNSDAGKEMLRKRVVTLRTAGIKPLLPDIVKKTFLNLPEDERYQRHLERFTAQDPENFARYVEGIIAADIAPELPKIRCPMLVISGEHDIMMPSDSAQRIKAMAPHAETTMMTEVAHFIPFQRPDKFAPAAADYVARVIG